MKDWITPTTHTHSGGGGVPTCETIGFAMNLRALDNQMRIDDDSHPTPQGGEGAIRGSHPSAQVGRLHRLWRRLDEVYIKPLFGGRKRGAYRVQVAFCRVYVCLYS